MKKLYILAGSALSSAAVFADGPVCEVDTTSIQASLQTLSSSLTGFVTAALPIVASVGAGFMAFWLGRMVFGLIKNWANAGK